MDDLLELFRRTPYLRSLVGQISLPVRQESDALVSEIVSIELITELPHIHTLAFGNTMGTTSGKFCVSFRPIALACVKRYLLMQTLHIGSLTFQ